jgi:hypothetical protein
MGVMSTNGKYRTGKGIMVGENLQETTETYVVEAPDELRQKLSAQLQIPLGSILYHIFTLKIHYPK